MRTIKFRAWDEKRKAMMYILTGIIPHGIREKRDFFMGFNSSGLEVSEYEGKGVWRIFPIMQWTGFCDITGAEIYESDVVRLEHDTGDEETAIVEWSTADGAWVIMPRNEVLGDLFHGYRVTVIGNAHADPELAAQVRGGMDKDGDVLA